MEGEGRKKGKGKKIRGPRTKLEDTSKLGEKRKSGEKRLKEVAYEKVIPIE